MAWLKEIFPKSLLLWKFNIMIFFTVGNEYRNFQRMTNLVTEISPEFPKEEIFYQFGHSLLNNEFSKNVTSQRFLPREQFERLITNSRLVITHAGAGTLLKCFEQNICPLVLPRRLELNEHLNNHQLDILNEFCKQNLCINIDKLNIQEIIFIMNKRSQKNPDKIKFNELLLKKLKESVDRNI